VDGEVDDRALEGRTLDDRALEGRTLRNDRRGLAIICALAITETCSFGVVFYGFGTFLPSMERALGWSKLTLTGAFSVALLLSGVAGLVIGKYLDTHSARLPMTFGSIVAAACTFGWSHASSQVGFYALWTIMGLAMGAIFYEPAFIVLSQRFTGAARRTALTVVTLFAGLASTIFVPFEEYLIRTRGWRGALRILALLLAVVTVPLHLFVLESGPKRTPETTLHHVSPLGQGNLTVREAQADPRFWFLLASGCLLSLTFAALIPHQLALLQERGWSSARAATWIGSIGLWQVGGRLVFAPLIRFTSSRMVTVAVYACQFAAVVVLAVSSTTVMLAVFVACTGLARGMFTLVRATLAADIFGTTNYGAIASRIGLAGTVAQGIAPIGASVLRRVTGGYTAMLWTLAAIAFVATLLASQVQHPRLQPR
jgi:MFS family permease